MKVCAILLLAIVGSDYVFALDICETCGYWPNSYCCSEKPEDPIDFLLTVPLKLTVGTLQNACLYLFRVDRQMMIFATIKLTSLRNSTVHHYVTGTFYHKKKQACFTMNIPDVDLIVEDQLQFVTLLVELRVHENFWSSPTMLRTSRLLVLVPKKISVFIETDKSVYKPGQTVRFRVLQLYYDSIVNDTVEKISILDPAGRRLWESHGRVPKYGLVSDQFRLISEAVEGNWKIQTQIQGHHLTYEINFSVEEYVLPRFEVVITGPTYVIIGAESFSLDVCGKYTYGKPVNGSIKGQLSVFGVYGRYTSQIAYLQTDENGCSRINANPEFMNNVNRAFHQTYEYGDVHFVMKTDITDFETNSTRSASFRSKVVLKPYQLNIIDWDDFGPDYSFKVSYKDIAGKPLNSRIIEADVKFYSDGNPMLQTYRSATDRDGIASFGFQIQGNSSYSVKVYDPAIPTELNVTKSLHIVTTPASRESYILTHNYAKLHSLKDWRCNQTIFVNGEIGYKHSSTSAVPEINYQIVVHQKSVSVGVVDQVICHENGEQIRRCKITFQIHTGYWNPKVKVLIFYAIGHEVISASSAVETRCPQNQALLNFSSDTALPKGKVNITLESSPNSVCSLSIVDKSVHLLGGSHNRITEEAIKLARQDPDYRLRAVTYFTTTCLSYILDTYVNSDEDVISISMLTRTKRSVIPDRKKRSVIPEDDLYFYGSEPDVFEDSGLAVVTNFHMYIEQCDLYLTCTEFGRPCTDYDVASMEFVDASMEFVDGHQRRRAKVIPVRNYFPETWKWDLIDLGGTGRAQIEAQLPDTITDWIATTYCISHDTGIHFANTAKITGFKPMFLSINMPYSVIHGEVVTLRTSLFSYYEKNVCLQMIIALDYSGSFELLNEVVRVTRACVCGQQLVSVDFKVRLLKLGNVKFGVKTWSESGDICGMTTLAKPDATDGVERYLLVESEGIEVQKSYGDYFCLTDGESKSFMRDYISSPDHFQGSSVLVLNVVGSLMGPSLANLDQLIQKPYGCGEQNMITMVPNLIALKYLASIGELTEYLRTEIEQNLCDGYQRQVTFQRADGSFSAFGDDDDSGSTWLTAFVIWTFRQIKKHTDIYVDDIVLERAAQFLQYHVRDDGCVEKVGIVHDKAVIGGPDGYLALNAYIALALYDEDFDADNEIWRFWFTYTATSSDILGCDGSAEMTTYAKAMKFYTSALKGNLNAAKTLWNSLKNLAIFEGESFDDATAYYWTNKPRTQDEYHYGLTNEIEVTGYVLLGMLKMVEDFPEEFKLLEALKVVMWLSSKMNIRGGFISTQDTVVGISAIAAFARLTNQDSFHVNVTASHGTSSTNFTVDTKNMLVTQQKIIRQPSTSITIHAQGNGCLLLQSNLKYNIPEKPVVPSFTVAVHVRSVAGGCDNPKFRYMVVCATYQGTRQQPTSNMAVFEITLVSGYEALRQSLEKMIVNNNENGLKRYEIDQKKITFYFRAIGQERKCAGFELTQTDNIENQKPGFVHVYDYYDPEKEATTSYNLSCVWENYNKGQDADCLKWDEFGVCQEICKKRKFINKSYQCISLDQHSPTTDLCGTVRNICSDHGKCINENGMNYRCICDEGYIFRWGTCLILANTVDEELPVLTSPSCDGDCPLPAWILREGGFESYVCMSGYTLRRLGRQSYCEDTDECQYEPCTGVNQVCKNFNGSYECACKLGYQYPVDADEGIVDKSHCVQYADDPTIGQDLPYHVGSEASDSSDSDADDVSDYGADISNFDGNNASYSNDYNRLITEMPVPDRDNFLVIHATTFSNVDQSTPASSDESEAAVEDGDRENSTISHDLEIMAPNGREPSFAKPASAASCANCYIQFPKTAQLTGILCPKRNVYLAKNDGRKMILRPIVLNGKQVTKMPFSFHGFTHLSDCLPCLTLETEKSIVITAQTLTNESKQQFFFNETITILPKRAWKKIQKFECVTN